MKKLLFIFPLIISSIITFGQAVDYYQVSSVATMKAFTGRSNHIHVSATGEDFELCTSCTADEVYVYAGAGGKKWKKISDPYKIEVVNGLTDMIAYAGTATVISVKGDTARGGTFYYRASGFTVDNGIIFPATGLGGGTKTWVRQYNQSGGADIRWWGAKGDNSTDNAVACDSFATYLSRGNATGIIPEGVFKTSHQFKILGSGVTLIMRGTLKNTSSSVRSFFSVGNSSNIVRGFKLIGQNGVIDGAGSLVTWTELVGTRYDAALLDHVNGYSVSGMTFKNGILGGLTAYGCHDGNVSDCHFDSSRKANGFSVVRDYKLNYTGQDSTAADVVATNCSARGNADFGFTVFDAHNVTLNNCFTYQNGNDDTTQLNTGGGFSVEDANPIAIRNKRYYSVKLINCKSIYDREDGFFISAQSVLLQNCDADSVTTQLSNPNGFLGVGLYAPGANYVDVIGGHFSGCDGAGIYFINTNYPLRGTSFINVEATNNGTHGIRLQGLDSVVIRGGRFARNGTNGIFINNSSSTYNIGLGTVSIDGVHTYQNNGNGLNLMHVYSYDIKNCKFMDDQVTGATGNASVKIVNTNSGTFFNNSGYKNSSSSLTRLLVTDATDTTALIGSNLRFGSLTTTDASLTDRTVYKVLYNTPLGYFANYGSSFGAQDMVDKNYVDSSLAAATGSSAQAMCASMPALTVASSTTTYAAPGTFNNTLAAEANRTIVLPTSIRTTYTIRNLEVKTLNAQDASGAITITVRKNGAATTLVGTVTAGAAAGKFKDITHSFTAASEDIISIELANAATATSAQIQSISFILIQ